MPSNMGGQFKPSGKKSHACGPCRRLKRKCDLQIPCSTCKTGRNTRIGECLANPATPLNNAQERTAPNTSFGRLQVLPQDSVPDNAIKQQPAAAAPPPPPQKLPKLDERPFPPFERPNMNHGRAQSTHEVHRQGMNDPSMSYTGQHVGYIHNSHVQPWSPVNHNEDDGIHQQNYQHQVQQQFQPLAHGQVPQQFPHIRRSFDASIAPQTVARPLSQTNINTPPQHGYDASPSEQVNLPGSLNTDHLSPSSTVSTSIPSSTAAAGPAINQLQAHIDWQNKRLKALEGENAQQRKEITLLTSRLKLEPMNDTQIPTHPNNEQRRNSTNNDFKKKYIKLLPSKTQTNFLVEFYLQNIDYIYHPIHHPSFRKSLENFWGRPDDVDIGWLATLLMVLGLATIHLPKGLINISSEDIASSHQAWFDASRDCIQYADALRSSPSEFNLYMLEWFSLCQLYFYATKRSEQLNDFLNAAIKHALDMGLDKDDKDNQNILEVEMKRRLWWDICGCDTYRALSLGKKPLIKSYNSTVPFPSNANDEDINGDSIKILSMKHSTDNSFNIYRALMMKIMNGIFEKNHRVSFKDMHSLELIKDEIFKGLLEVDIELCQTNKSWFFELSKDGTLPYILGSRIHFQHHMLHTCICIHRFRIYQNYLQDGIYAASEVARTTACSLFTVYRKLRMVYDLRNPLFLPQIHQSFTGSVIQSMMLLVCRDLSRVEQASLYSDIDLMLNDLKTLSDDVFILKPEILKESFKVLEALKKSLNKNLVELEKDQKDIVSNVFGGKVMTESYLRKCTVSFIVDQNDKNNQSEIDEDQPTREGYNASNQIGALIDESVLERSLPRFKELELEKSRGVKPPSTHRRKKVILPPPTGNTPIIVSDFENSHNLSTVQNVDVSMNSEKTWQGDQKQTINENYTTHNPFVAYTTTRRQTTPLNLLEGFWSEIGEEGIDELNNLYNNEFSGYKVL